MIVPKGTGDNMQVIIGLMMRTRFENLCQVAILAFTWHMEILSAHRAMAQPGVHSQHHALTETAAAATAVSTICTIKCGGSVPSLQQQCVVKRAKYTAWQLCTALSSANASMAAKIALLAKTAKNAFS